jgi:hypothetical protein
MEETVNILQAQERGVPVLCPIKSGWAARGNGWAVHAPTQEEALEKFRETEALRREILSRPDPHRR